MTFAHGDRWITAALSQEGSGIAVAVNKKKTSVNALLQELPQLNNEALGPCIAIRAELHG